MAVKTHIGDANGMARQVKKLYAGDADGIARELKALYVGDASGIARLIFQKAPPPPLYELGKDWWEGTLPESGYFNDLVYGDDRFIAVGMNNCIYSTDGINWTKGNAINVNPDLPSGIAYGNGIFVVSVPSSTKNRVIYSSNGGKTWFERSLSTGSTAKWQDVAFGNGKFVMVSSGGGGIIVYSTNGSTWTAGKAASGSLPTSLGCVAYGGGKFVAVPYNGTKGAYSSDGINWTPLTFPASAKYPNITYGGGKFVVVSNGKSEGLYSSDGINWNTMQLPTYTTWKSVSYGEGIFIAAANKASHVAYSTNGIHWELVPTPVEDSTNDTSWYCVAYGKGMFVVLQWMKKSFIFSSKSGPA